MTEEIEKDEHFARYMDLYVFALEKLTKVYNELNELANAGFGSLFEQEVDEAMCKIIQIIGRLLFDIYIRGYLTIHKE